MVRARGVKVNFINKAYTILPAQPKLYIYNPEASTATLPLRPCLNLFFFVRSTGTKQTLRYLTKRGHVM
jgi:hypothetical protein